MSRLQMLLEGTYSQETIEGKFNIYMLVDGQVEPSKQNKEPLTWERARAYISPILRLMGHDASGFRKVYDVSIIPDALTAEEALAVVRDAWLLDIAKNGFAKLGRCSSAARSPADSPEPERWNWRLRRRKAKKVEGWTTAAKHTPSGNRAARDVAMRRTG